MSITPEAAQAAKELGEMDDEEFAAAMDNAREILNPDHLTIGVVDTETTGLDLEEDEIIEIAMTIVRVDLKTGKSEIIGTHLEETEVPEYMRVTGGAFESMANPDRPIPPDSSRVHHITSDDVQLASKTPDVLKDFQMSVIKNGVDVLCAHNAAFDRPFIESHTGPMVPWICTYRIARRAYPEAKHGCNSYFRYYLGHKIPVAGPVHRALFDTLVTAMTLCRIIEDKGLGAWIVRKVEEGKSRKEIAAMLQAFSDRPRKIEVMEFGKHKGEPLTSLPTSYLEWLSASANDTDMQHNARVELERREQEKVAALEAATQTTTTTEKKNG